MSDLEKAGGERPARDPQIMNLRVLAILLVVIGHSIILYSTEWDLYSPPAEYPPFNVAKIVINAVQMPLFFSVSGFLFPHTLSHKNLTFSKFVRDKALRLLVPFLFIAFCWLLPIRLLIHYPGYMGKNLAEIVFRGILWGDDVGHLWFLPALFLVFIVMWAAVRILIPRLGIFPVAALFLILSLASHFLDFNTFVSQAAANTLWFFLGYLIYKRRASGKQTSASIRAAAAGATLTLQIVGVYLHTHPGGGEAYVSC
jgi:fucose 4-O-acetylase-like acetyltransferase